MRPSVRAPPPALQLIFRTLNKAMGRPNCNEDDLAPLFMKKLMPVRSWWLGALPWHRSQFRVSLGAMTIRQLLPAAWPPARAAAPHPTHARTRAPPCA